jgi:hypothetical protein
MNLIPYASITMVVSFTLAAVRVCQAFKTRKTKPLQSTGLALVALGFSLVFLTTMATLVLYKHTRQTSDPWIRAMTLEASGLVVSSEASCPYTLPYKKLTYSRQSTHRSYSMFGVSSTHRSSVVGCASSSSTSSYLSCPRSWLSWPLVATA